ncbi:MAG: hypothetical protein ACP5L5_11590 [Vulcanisaeta sp.]|uniref:hypothetical protein n=1 Tax=Vulcanisaeta sp. TaxID=2020871 RepID=UPI003D0E71EB
MYTNITWLSLDIDCTVAVMVLVTVLVVVDVTVDVVVTVVGIVVVVVTVIGVVVVTVVGTVTVTLVGVLTAKYPANPKPTTANTVTTIKPMVFASIMHHSSLS